MNDYGFELVVAGIAITDHDEIDRIAEELNSDDQEFDLHFADGVALAEFACTADGEFEALCGALEQLRRVAPTLVVERLHRRLVGVADIASQLGVTDEAARLITRGQRRSDPDCPFPNPVEVLKGGRRIWLWSEVCRWLKAHDELANEPIPIAHEAATLFDAHLLGNPGRVPAIR